MSDYVTDEMVETAARARWISEVLDPRSGATREWCERAWDDMGGSEPSDERADEEIYMRAALEAVAPAIAAQALRSVLDMRHDFEAVWDDGNAVGLDGWTGPGRGSGEVDDYAIRARERAVNRLEAHIATRAETTTDLPALLAAVEAVLALHPPIDVCGNARHTNLTVSCPDCETVCDFCASAYPCPTVRAVREALSNE